MIGGKKKPKCLQSLPAFSVQFSCQNFFCAWLKLMCEQMTNYQIYKHFFFNLKHHFAKCKCFLGGKSKQLLFRIDSYSAGAYAAVWAPTCDGN